MQETMEGTLRKMGNNGKKVIGLHASKFIMVLLLLVASLLGAEGIAMGRQQQPPPPPPPPPQQPTSFHFYLHDTIFSKNRDDDTSTLVGGPGGGPLRALAPGTRFGDVVVFEDVVTRAPARESERVGTAQGFYVYSGRHQLGAFWSFTAFIDGGRSPGGSLTVMGAERILQKGAERQLAVVSGTGDFQLARGFATLTTIKVVGTTYFTLLFNFTLSYDHASY